MDERLRLGHQHDFHTQGPEAVTQNQHKRAGLLLRTDAIPVPLAWVNGGRTFGAPTSDRGKALNP
jgi:hypothetical protein